MSLQRLFLAACILLGGFGDAVAQWRPGFGFGQSRGGFQFQASGGNAIPGALADFDFKNDRYTGPPLSVSRASTGYIDDSLGQWSVVPANTLRRSDKGVLVEEARTNSVRNNSMQGASAGAPGVIPTNWTMGASANGITRSVAAVGVESGIEYIDLRFAGTASAFTAFYLQHEGSNVVSAAQGQTWTASAFYKLISGSLPATKPSISSSGRVSGGGDAFDVTTVPVNATGASLASQRYVATRTFTNVSTIFVMPFTAVTIANGETVDFTIRIGWPQLEQGAFATSPIRTTGTAATRAADVITSSLDQPTAVSRAASGYAEDLSGNWIPFAPNTVRRTNKGTVIEAAATNLVNYSDDLANSAWLKGTSNGTTAPVATSNYATAPDGTQTAARIQITLPGDAEWSLARRTGIPASSGASHRFSIFLKATDSSQVGKKVSTGAFDGSTFYAATPVTLTDQWQRVSVAGSPGAATTDIFVGKHRVAQFHGSTNAEAATDFLVWGTQFESGSILTSPIRTTGTAVTRDADVVTATVGDALSYVSRPAPAYISDPDGTWRSVPANTLRRSGSTTLVESAATNFIRNNSGQGLVSGLAGSTGTPPSGWAGNLTTNGLNQEYIGTGTANGINYVRTRVYGTLTAPLANVQYLGSATNDMPLTTGQSATASVFLRLVSGGFGSEALDLTFRENDVSSAFLRQTLVNTKTMGSSWTRFSNPVTAGASTAMIAVGLRINAAQGNVVDFTIDIGWPQLETGLTATSPIRTTNAAVTRPADVVTRSATLAAIAAPNTPTANASNQNILALSDGTVNNRAILSRNSGTGFISGFAFPPSTTFSGSVVNQGARFAASAGFADSDRGLSVNGATEVANTTAGAFPLVNQIRIGDRGDGLLPWNGYIERVAVLPNRMSNADLQLLSSLSAWDAPFAFGVGTSFPAFASAVDYDFKGDRYFGPAISVSRASTAYIDDAAGNWVQAAANVLRRSNKGVLIEEARTNSIRNNSMQGAASGSPGTAPTNNTIAGSVDGLTRTINLVGQENGIDIIEVRWVGTTSAAQTNRAFFSFENTTQIAAVSGQTWNSSVFASVAAGSLSGLTITHGPIENTSGGAYVSGQFTPMAPTSSLTRFSSTRTLSGGTTAFINSGIFFSYASGVAVDITLRIGWPQLEQGAFATSPIRTTGTAATRAADVITAPLTAIPAATIVGIGQSMVPGTISSNQFLGSVSDGTFNNRATLGRNGSGNIFALYGAGSITALSALAAGYATRFAAAGGITANDVAVSLNGASPPVNLTANPFPTVNQMQVGMSGAGTGQLNGYIERLVVYPTRVPNSRLQELSQLSSFGG